MWYGLIFFALALNIDAMGAGLSYGIRKIKLPLLSMAIICLISMGAISVSMQAGHFIGQLVSPNLSKHVGGGILLILGVWAIYQYFTQEESKEELDLNRMLQENITVTKQEPITLLNVKILGIMIKILKDPHIVDLDQSGVISGREAFLLGVALSLDSLAAGMAVSLLGFNILETALCVGLGQILFTYLGTNIGFKLRHTSIGRQIAVLPGIILMFLGISRFF